MPVSAFYICIEVNNMGGSMRVGNYGWARHFGLSFNWGNVQCKPADSNFKHPNGESFCGNEFSNAANLILNININFH